MITECEAKPILNLPKEGKRTNERQQNAKRRQNRTKTESFTLWMEKEEKETWIEKMKEKKLGSLAQFVRYCVDYVLYQQNTSMNPSNINQIEEMKELLKEMKAERENRNYEIQESLDHLSQKTPERDTRPLEEKIITHLTGRKLYLNQLSDYCQEPPGILLQTLSQMQNAKQETNMKWKLI